MRYLTCFFVLLWSLPSVYGAEPELYASLIMTAGQKNDSLPTDAGLFIHDETEVGWHRFGPKIQFINGVAISPVNSDIIFLACGNGVAMTRDGGTSWKLVTGWRESDIQEIAIDPQDGKTVYAASIWGLTVSRDAGLTWDYAVSGLPALYCRTVVVDQAQPDRLLLGTEAGIFVSEDRAETWTPVTLGPGVNILDLEQSKADSKYWMAGTEHHGVFLSSDNGETWTQTLPEAADRNMYAVGRDPKNLNRLVAGGLDTGVWISLDGGASWASKTEGLPSDDVTAIAIEPSPQAGRIWVSTFEEGTFFSDDDGETWQDAKLPGAYVFDLRFLERP